MAGCEPARRLSWRWRHRSALQFMVSTGRLHGFESILLVLDFIGTAEEVLFQPFRLQFETAGGEAGEHVPDFLAMFREGPRRPQRAGRGEQFMHIRKFHCNIHPAGRGGTVRSSGFISHGCHLSRLLALSLEGTVTYYEDKPNPGGT